MPVIVYGLNADRGRYADALIRHIRPATCFRNLKPTGHCKITFDPFLQNSRGFRRISFIRTPRGTLYFKLFFFMHPIKRD